MELPISYEERGKEIGKEIGKKIGREEGRKQERKRMARNMLQKGLDIKLIAESTMLSMGDVEAIKKELE